MSNEQDTQPKLPGARTYKVEQMVRAAEKGAAQQIERMKKMMAQGKAQQMQEPGGKHDTGKNSFTDSSD